MQSVLGIDAAWTSTQPSGVALVTQTPNGWRLRAVESSDQRFQALADSHIQAEDRPSGSRPDTVPLLASVEKISGWVPNLVAIDMPLAHAPIVGRRASDKAVSQAYGARKCGTHTPNALRPGRLSE
jgi:predicted RNase H-like nuclease